MQSLDSSKNAQADSAYQSLLGRRRSPQGKWISAALMISLGVNGMLILYCANLLFLTPLAYDRVQELNNLEREDSKLKAQRSALEATTRGLITQKEQLLQHYKETEDVGKKLASYKAKLAADAIEVKNAESTAEDLMRRLASAQGSTIATKRRLIEEKEKLKQVQTELDKVIAEQKRLKHSEKVMKRSQQEDALVKALEENKQNLNAEERGRLCQACTCVKYC